MKPGLYWTVLVCAIVALACGCLSQGGTETTTQTTGQPGNPAITGSVIVAKAADIKPNTITKFDYNGQPAILVSFDGSYMAYINNCPHQNRPFNESSLQGDRIVCPYHKATFDPKSGKYLGNANGGNFGISGLTTISINVKDGNIYAG
jgi:nitrite reductase/ring-hydroxylating ferredoxin subunit